MQIRALIITYTDSQVYVTKLIFLYLYITNIFFESHLI